LEEVSVVAVGVDGVEEEDEHAITTNHGAKIGSSTAVINCDMKFRV
jgi:hypothetical protein